MIDRTFRCAVHRLFGLEGNIYAQKIVLELAQLQGKSSKRELHSVSTRLLLQFQTCLSWHERAFGRRSFLPELIRHLLHGHKLDSFVFHKVLD
jgi:hypothetical protein